MEPALAASNCSIWRTWLNLAEFGLNLSPHPLSLPFLVSQWHDLDSMFSKAAEALGATWLACDGPYSNANTALFMVACQNSRRRWACHLLNLHYKSGQKVHFTPCLLEQRRAWCPSSWQTWQLQIKAPKHIYIAKQLQKLWTTVIKQW